MSICDTVKSLAESIADALPPDSARVRLCVEMLRLMPLFRDARDLSAWERSYRAINPGDALGSVCEKLLEDLYEFACLNMYGAIDVRETVEEYAALVQSLKKAGVQIPPHAPLDHW